MSSQVGPRSAEERRDDPSFTMSIASPIQGIPRAGSANWFISIARYGGARRDRTDDLMLAKHALYQLSYGPISEPSQESWSLSVAYI